MTGICQIIFMSMKMIRIKKRKPSAICSTAVKSSILSNGKANLGMMLNDTFLSEIDDIDSGEHLG